MKQTDSKSNIPLLIRNFYVHLINRPYEFTLKNNKVFISSRYLSLEHTHERGVALSSVCERGWEKGAASAVIVSS